MTANARWTVQTHNSARIPREARASIGALFRVHELRTGTQLARLPYELLFEVFQHLMPQRAPPPRPTSELTPCHWAVLRRDDLLPWHMNTTDAVGARQPQDVRGDINTRATCGLLVLEERVRPLSVVVQPSTGNMYVATYNARRQAGVAVYSPDGKRLRFDVLMRPIEEGHMHFSVDGDILYVSSGAHILNAWDVARDGALMLRDTVRQSLCYRNSLTVDALTGRVFGAWQDCVYEYDPLTLEHKYVWGGIINGYPSMVAHGDRLYILDNDCGLSRLREMLLCAAGTAPRLCNVSELPGVPYRILFDGVGGLVVMTCAGVYRIDIRTSRGTVLCGLGDTYGFTTACDGTLLRPRDIEGCIQILSPVV